MHTPITEEFNDRGMYYACTIVLVDPDRLAPPSFQRGRMRTLYRMYRPAFIL